MNVTFVSLHKVWDIKFPQTSSPHMDLGIPCQWESIACLQHSAYKEEIEQFAKHCTSRVEEA